MATNFKKTRSSKGNVFMVLSPSHREGWLCSGKMSRDHSVRGLWQIAVDRQVKAGADHGPVSVSVCKWSTWHWEEELEQ